MNQYSVFILFQGTGDGRRVPAHNLAASWLPIGPWGRGCNDLNADLKADIASDKFKMKYFCCSDDNFKMSITPFNFHQIQHPAPVLNAELQGLFETGIGIKIWPSIDREMTV